MARTLKCDTIMDPGSNTANITLSSSVTNFGSINVDINGGTIDGCTIGNSSITVPSGSTLHISAADSFTTSETQKNDILNGSSALVLTNINTSNNYADVEITGDLKVSGNDIKGGNATMNFQPDGTNTEMSIDTSGNLTIEGMMTVKGGEFLNPTNAPLNSTNTAFDFSTKYNGTQAVTMALRNDGDLIVAGDITAFGTPSDERMKENINPLVADDIIQNFMGFNVRQFTYKEEYKSHAVREGTQIGFIAQEVEKMLPEAVQTKENGMKAINYDVLVAVLFSVIQELYIRQIKMNTSLVQNQGQDTAEEK